MNASSMVRLRRLALCLALACPAVLASGRPARASLSIAITYDALLKSSNAVVIGTAVEQHAVWESDRIYSYSRLHVDTAIAGELRSDDEVWIRTMGGVVGDVGQIVDGEAVLTVGRPSMMFVARTPEGAYVVTARAQGQFGLYTDDQKQVRLRRSAAVGGLLPPLGTATVGPLAGDVIHGRAVVDASRDIAAAWSHAHGS